MMTACNMPFNMVDKKPFRHFFSKYITEWKLPCRKTLQNFLPLLRERTENHIKQEIYNKKLWLTVDETTDCQKNSIANVIVRILHPLGPTFPYLLASKRLAQCTGEAIIELVLTTIQKFDISPNQVLLFLSDGTTSMRVVGHSLKSVFPNLLHVTCLLHALHLVAETIQKCYPNVDALIVNTKAVFCKSKHIQEFHKQCPGIPQPPQLIVPHWGTWLEGAFYYLEHFQKIKALVLQFNSSEATAIKDSQTQFEDAHIEEDLQTIHNNYVMIADAINRLQNTSLLLAEALQIIDTVQTALQTLNDEKGIRVREKFNSVLSKNTDLARLRQIDNNIPTDEITNFKECFTYANITSLDAEQSFSLYKDIFSPRRTMLTETTAETYLMAQMFSRAHPDF